jgi:hypothetical protein
VEAVPLHLCEANEFVAEHHRHCLPTVGGKFAVGAAVDDKLVGVAIAGRLSGTLHGVPGLIRTADDPGVA